jgi:hypothetical protein
MGEFIVTLKTSRRSHNRWEEVSREAAISWWFNKLPKHYSSLNELAQELEIQIPADGYLAYMATRDTGAIGGHNGSADG